MWQVLAHPNGGNYVRSALSEGITIMFLRAAGGPVCLSIVSNEAEPRAFDKGRLPVITVDEEPVFDLNEEMKYQKERTDQDWCFSEDRQVGARIWSGTDTVLLPHFTIAKFINGNNLSVRIFFNLLPIVEYEYNISLAGFADAFQQAFGLSIGQATTSDAFGTASSGLPPPDAAIDRVAIRSMVEDFWRSFMSVAVTNPQIGAQSIQSFDERIQATASLMSSEKAKAFLEAVDQERDLLFNEYRRNPDALRRRLGLAPLNQPSVVTHQRGRQGIGEMAVRTAVRATVWETVISLFRAFR